MKNYIEMYYEYLLFEKCLSNQTIITYKNQINKFINHLQTINISINEVNTEDIRDFLTHCKNNNDSDKTISLLITVLKSFYNFLTKDKLIDNNPMIKIINNKASNKLPTVLTKDEIDKLLSVIDCNTLEGIRDKTIIEFLFSTGCRVSELTNLLLNQLIYNKEVVILKGKSNKERISYLNESCLKMLKLYLTCSRPNLLKLDGNSRSSNYLFVGNSSDKLNRTYVLNMIKKYAKISNIKKIISPHTFRHSFATLMLENGANLMAIKELLGHENISTTQIYTHIATKQLKNTYENVHPFGKEEK